MQKWQNLTKILVSRKNPGQNVNSKSKKLLQKSKIAEKNHKRTVKKAWPPVLSAPLSRHLRHTSQQLAIAAQKHSARSTAPRCRGVAVASSTARQAVGRPSPGGGGAARRCRRYSRWLRPPPRGRAQGATGGVGWAGLSHKTDTSATQQPFSGLATGGFRALLWHSAF